jgi:hypothetical protein
MTNCSPRAGCTQDFTGHSSHTRSHYGRSWRKAAISCATSGSFLSTDYLLPAQRAAFYKFLATVQGASVASDVRDAAGRPGTGLVWSVQGVKWMLIFDSRTFAYLGVKLGDGSGQAGWIFSDAQLQKAIVNRPGQLP